MADINNSEFLAEAVYLSVDPYMRGFASDLPLGQTFFGSQAAKIIESKNPKYPVGEHVVGKFGWRTHTISAGDPRSLVGTDIIPQLVSKKLTLSPALGAVGMPGNTAYFGFLEICHPKPGETVVVSGAAGAVGNQVELSIDRIIFVKQLRIEGFVVYRWLDRWNEGAEQNLEWIQQGKLKYHETVTEGSENMFTAFVEMLKSVNVGKAVVKV